LRVQVKAVQGVQCEHGLEQGKCQRVEKAGMQQWSHQGTAQGGDHCLEGERRALNPGKCFPPGGGQGFRQPQCHQNQVDQRQPGCREGWDRITPLAEQSTHSRSNNEAQPKSSTNHTQPAGAVFLIRHIGDICLCHADISAGETRQDTGGKQHHQVASQTQQHETQHVSKHADQQDRSAPKAIGNATQQGCTDQLGSSIGCHQQAGDNPICTKISRIIGQQRKNQAETKQVNENNEKDGK